MVAADCFGQISVWCLGLVDGLHGLVRCCGIVFCERWQASKMLHCPISEWSAGMVLCCVDRDPTQPARGLRYVLRAEEV